MIIPRCVICRCFVNSGKPKSQKVLCPLCQELKKKYPKKSIEQLREILKKEILRGERCFSIGLK
jgi:hypothetical protein